MNSWKKSMAVVLAGAMALSMPVAINSSVSHAEGETPAPTGTPAAGETKEEALEGIYIDFTFAKMTVQVKAGNKQVMVGTTSEKKGVYTEPKAWDIYDLDGNSQDVSLAHLVSSKDQCVMVKTTNSEKPVVIKFTAAASKLKAKYNAAKHVAEITSNGSALAKDVKLESRTTYTSYQPVAQGADMSAFEQQGATVYFRTAAINKISPSAKNIFDASNAGLKTTVGDYDCYEVGSFPSADLKVKVTKLANAPSVSKIDYAARQFKIKKKTEYRFNYGKWTAAGEADKTVDLPDDNAGLLEVRTAATTGEKAKAASKIMQYSYAAVDKLKVVTPAEGDKEDLLKNKIKKTDDTEELTWKYDDLKVSKIASLKLSFANASKDRDYEVYYTGTKLTEDKLETVYNKGVATKLVVKANGKADLKYSSKIASPTYVYVRYAANTKTKLWASPVVYVGKIDMKGDWTAANATPTPSATAEATAEPTATTTPAA